MQKCQGLLALHPQLPEITQFKLCCLKRMIDWWTSRRCSMFLRLIHTMKENVGMILSLQYSMNACSLILLSLTQLLGSVDYAAKSCCTNTQPSCQYNVLYICMISRHYTRNSWTLISWSIKYSTTWISLLQNQIAHALLLKCSCIYMQHVKWHVCISMRPMVLSMICLIYGTHH